MKYIAFFCAVIFMTTSCKNPNTQESTKHDWKFENLSVDKMVHIDNDSTKEGMKLHLEFTYPSSYANDTILGYVQNVFVHAYAGDSINLNPKEAFAKIERERVEQALIYGDEARDDGPDFSGYFQSIVTSVSDSSNIQNYITAKTHIEQYTGGAHGMHNTEYFNIDTRTGDYISEEVLFQPNKKGDLTALIKELLTDRANSKNDDAITLLDPESIEPNGNFYFSNEGVVYVFNTYEIAPYSNGLIEVKLPYDRIKIMINPNYSFLFSK